MTTKKAQAKTNGKTSKKGNERVLKKMHPAKRQPGEGSNAYRRRRRREALEAREEKELESATARSESELLTNTSGKSISLFHPGTTRFILSFELLKAIGGGFRTAQTALSGLRSDISHSERHSPASGGLDSESREKYGRAGSETENDRLDLLNAASDSFTERRIGSNSDGAGIVNTVTEAAGLTTSDPREEPFPLDGRSYSRTPPTESRATSDVR